MYRALAKFYDALMADVDYDAWADYVAQFLPPSGHGVDLACGTGKFTFHLTKRGFSVYGVDQSIEMLNIAKQNALAHGNRAMFLQGSIETFVPNAPLDFAVILCDGMNYVTDLAAAFQNLNRMIKTDGTLIFDFSTEYKLKNVLANNTFVLKTADAYCVWQNQLLSKSRRVEMTLDIFERENDLYRRASETQTQVWHTQDAICESLAAAGFCVVGCYGGLTKRAPKPNAERIHVVAKKL